MEALKIGIDAPEPAWAQQQTQRVAGTIDKVEGKTLYIKSASGPVTLTLADNAVIVARVKATAADIRAGDYVASGGAPQPDGTQKGVELRIFPDGMRVNGEGHRPGWPTAPNGTMTNGAVGQTVSSVDGPVLTVKYRDGENKIIVGPSVPVTRLEVANKSELKSGVAVAAAAATKKPDGTFTAARIDFGRGDVLPWAAGPCERKLRPGSPQTSIRAEDSEPLGLRLKPSLATSHKPWRRR